MALQITSCSLLLQKPLFPSPRNGRCFPPSSAAAAAAGLKTRVGTFRVLASTGNKGSLPNSNYVVPLDKSFSPSNSSCITRPLAEILRDLNKKVPDNIVKPRRSDDLSSPSTCIPWYHANRMLSFYAPGWCGEVRDVIFSDSGSVTVVYRLTIRGSDGEVHRESTGTVMLGDDQFTDPVTAAEEIAFCRVCARFGLGLYLYHEE